VIFTKENLFFEGTCESQPPHSHAGRFLVFIVCFVSQMCCNVCCWCVLCVLLPKVCCHVLQVCCWCWFCASFLEFVAVSVDICYWRLLCAVIQEIGYVVAIHAHVWRASVHSLTLTVSSKFSWLMCVCIFGRACGQVLSRKCVYIYIHIYTPAHTHTYSMCIYIYTIFIYMHTCIQGYEILESGRPGCCVWCFSMVKSKSRLLTRACIQVGHPVQAGVRWFRNQVALVRLARSHGGGL